MAVKNPETIRRKIRSNIKNCTKQFLELIADPELKELLGESYEPYLKEYAKTAVNRMAKSAFDQLNQDPNLSEAATQAIKQYMSDHYRLFREFKEGTIGQIVANNNLSAYLKSTVNKFQTLVSGFFANHFYLPFEGIQGSVGRHINQLKDDLYKPFAEELSVIANQENKDYTDIVALTTGGPDTAKIIDSIMKGAKGDTIHDKVARAIVQFTTRTRKLRERHGLPSRDIGDDFVVRVIHDPEKMVNIPDEIWEKYSNKNKIDLTPLELNQESKEVWANYFVERLDWNKSFPNVHAPDLKSKLDTLHGAWNNIVSEIKHSRPKNKKYTGLYTRMVGGQRQMFAKDGQAWLDMRAFGEEDLNKTIQGMAHSNARYISLVNKFGPNPEEGMAFVERTYRQLHPVGPETDKNIRTLYNWFDYYANTSAVKADMKTELATKLLLSLPNLFWLGKATMKSLGDVYTLWAAKRQQGLPNALRSSLQPITQYFFTASRANIDEFRKVLGYIDPAITLAANEVNARNLIKAGDHSGYTDKAISYLEKSGGLTNWDMLVRLSMTTSWSMQLADSVSKIYTELSPETQLVLKHAGIKPQEWDVLRSSPELIKEVQGTKLFVPFEASTISDELASKASGIDIKNKTQLRLFKNSFALKMNSALKAQSEAVVPTFNPTLDKEYITRKKAFLEDNQSSFFGINYQYMFYNLLNQYKTWAVNYQEVTLRRIWQGPSSTKSKIGSIIDMAGGAALTNTILDMAYGYATADEADKKTPFYENYIRNAVNLMGGRQGSYLIAFYSAVRGHGPEVNRTPSLDKLARIIREMSHVVVPKRNQTHKGALWELMKDTAPTFPVQVIMAALEMMTNGGE